MKHILIKAAALILAMGIMSCDKTSDCCTTIERTVSVLYKNDQGESLINSTSDFEEGKIKVYYKNGNDFEYVYDGNLDAPNMHKVYEDGDGNLVLKVHLSNYYDGTLSTTLVELNPNVVDTIVGAFDIGPNFENCTQAWLNGVEMVEKFIEVQK